MLVAAEDEECLDRLVATSCRKSTPDDGKPTVGNTTDPENEQALPPTKVFTQTRKLGLI